MSFYGAQAADKELPGAPGDTVQCLGWSPTANHLAAGAWDASVRVERGGGEERKSERETPETILKMQKPTIALISLPVDMGAPPMHSGEVMLISYTYIVGV